MPRWEPLADHIPVDVRRLATQLRRMKDRSDLTVPGLAARTAQGADMWERAFAARQLPPLHAVEVLAQASGADYDRIAALWRLAERASAGTGGPGRNRPVPYPDPLDPLGPEEGLPNRWRSFLLLGAVGLLAMATLVAVIFTSGPSVGRTPTGQAGPSVSGRSGAAAAAPGTHRPRSTAPTAAPGTGVADRGHTVPVGILSARGADPTKSTAKDGSTTPSAAPTTPTGGTGTGTPPASPPSTPPSTGTTPPPTSGPTSLCLPLVVLGVCLG